MPELEELRYPFLSAIEFFSGGYWHQIPALHLLFAWLCILVMVPMVLRQRRDMGQKLLALYFSLTLFNNYCFQFWVTSLAEIFGIISTILLLQRAATSPTRQFRLTWVAGFILICSATFTVHALLISTIYPGLNDSPNGVLRMCVIARVISLGLCVVLFRSVFHQPAHIDWLVRQVVNFAVVALICYFLQIAILLSGHLPYGTYMDAGFVGMPSFGSVSIERGHLGKFLTPLFPFFLLAWLRQGRKWSFLFFCVVTMINFSASSLSYFACYLLMTAWMFRSYLFKPRAFLWTTVALVAIVTFGIYFHEVLNGVLIKVVELGLKGDSSGGRDIGLLFEYLGRYPLGISYGGSAMREARGLDVIEGGIFPFISQMSILSVPLIGFLIFVELKVIRKSKRIATPYFRSALIIGAMVIPVIFAADSLWFVPTIWLPLIMCENMSFGSGSTPVLASRSRCLAVTRANRAPLAGICLERSSSPPGI
jgi:hypothetical protein